MTKCNMTCGSTMRLIVIEVTKTKREHTLPYLVCFEKLTDEGLLRRTHTKITHFKLIRKTKIFFLANEIRRKIPKTFLNVYIISDLDSFIASS
eukprot:CAMPEP_0194143998 /NCGR_PEP_ID=MMETSP0152-20130528/13099_1 /TAXON_ID=1049557 /ORGANISM="Thalassiothrix antarctica, Strain L6-D1" /LENGTH=92 /DNA_ID=CAMNT_0038843661 /DNA_START=359 /DNA_END=633 /DNA_ORIENTATION=+